MHTAIQTLSIIDQRMPFDWFAGDWRKCFVSFRFVALHFMFRMNWCLIGYTPMTVVLPACGLSRRLEKWTISDFIAKHNKLTADKMRAKWMRAESGCLGCGSYKSISVCERVLHFGIATNWIELNWTELMGFEFKFELCDTIHTHSAHILFPIQLACLLRISANSIKYSFSS